MTNIESKSANEVTSSSSSQPKRKHYIEYGPGNTDGAKDNDNKITYNMIRSWPNWDLWPFRICAPLLAAAGGATGFLLNRTFREGLVLGHHAKLSSYFATVMLPAIGSAVGHFSFITQDILRQDTLCPVCLQVNAALIQTGTGFVWPTLLAPVVNYMTGSGVKGIYLPKIQRDPKAMLELTLEIFRPVRTRYLAFGAMQVVVAMGVTYLEQNAFYTTLLPLLNDKDYSLFNKETRKKEFYKT